jgi:Mrp family chromosome partitioning ATPase/capsular polysaccharide biosynthesis protein
MAVAQRPRRALDPPDYTALRESLIDASQLRTIGDERSDSGLRPYLRAIRAHRLLVAAVTILACLAAVVWHTRGTPTYESSTKILLTPLTASDTTFAGVQLIRDSNDPTRIAQTAAALVESPQAALATARRIGGGATRAGVARAIKVRPEGQSNIIAVTASASSPAGAVRLADAYAAAALQRRGAAVKAQIDPIMSRLRASPLAADRARAAALRGIAADPTLSISQPAVAAGAPIGTATWLIALIALAAGFTIAATAALLMEHFDRRVREEQDFSGLYPVPILARIPKVRDRMFAAGDLTAVPPVVRDAYRTLQVQIEQLGSTSRTIMVTSGSGGDGKTSVAINLALALVASGHRVVVMDLDVRKPDLTRLLGLSDAADVMKLVTARAAVDDLLVHAPRLPPLVVMPGGRGEGEIVLLAALARRLPAILAEARSVADYVIIDTAPLGRVSDALQIVPHVDEVLVVARPGATERPHFELLRDLLSRAGVVPAGIVMTATTDRNAETVYGHGAGLDRLRPRSLAQRD